MSKTAELRYLIDAEPPRLELWIDEELVWAADEVVDFCYRPVRTKPLFYCPKETVRMTSPSLEDLEL